ncbi:hypothetical protein ACF1GW_39025 [Streptomyces achromogenes]|uniref:hypothetical protein n=1 Tax=Streptomyces achromogenes TaxID=67255 RepID=UPI0036FE93F7
MDAPAHDCRDLDQLLRLIGILGSPANEHSFWESWRPKDHGYGFKKIKAGIVALHRPDADHDYLARDFADYVLMLFATETPEGEAQLVDSIGRHITAGHSTAVGTQFLADLRNTAWRVWRDHRGPNADSVVDWWRQTSYPGER